MAKLSRRSLASYSADQLLAGKSVPLIARQLSAVIVDAGLSDQLDFLLGDIAWELEHRGSLAIGHVTSARPLTKELETAIKSQIKQAAGVDEVLLEEHVDGSVIGGVRIETSSHVWDSTLSQKLSRLREAF